MTQSKTHKQCLQCKELLPIEHFYQNPHGYSSKCKPCTIAYNTEYRKSRSHRPRPRKVPIYELHRKLLSKSGPQDSIFYGKYIHTRREFVLYLGPWGCVLDGELLYGTTSIDEIIDVLAHRHMRLMRQESVELKSVEFLSEISQVRNSCGVPIDVRFVQGLVLLDQYFLWMDMPRKLLISEAADQTSLSEEIVKFLVPEKSASNQKIAPPGNLKNPSTNNPQVIEFVEE